MDLPSGSLISRLKARLAPRPSLRRPAEPLVVRPSRLSSIDSWPRLASKVWTLAAPILPSLGRKPAQVVQSLDGGQRGWLAHWTVEGQRSERLDESPSPRSENGGRYRLGLKRKHENPTNHVPKGLGTSEARGWPAAKPAAVFSCSSRRLPGLASQNVQRPIGPTLTLVPAVEPPPA